MRLCVLIIKFKVQSFSISTVGFSNEDNCCQSEGIGKSFKEKLLRGAARIFRESKISDEKSNFFLFCPNIPFCELVSKKYF